MNRAKKVIAVIFDKISYIKITIKKLSTNKISTQFNSISFPSEKTAISLEFFMEKLSAILVIDFNV